MPFDTLAAAAVVDEVRAVVTRGRIQKIIQPSASAIGLSVYGDGAEHWIILSADARWARVALSLQRLAKAFSTPSPFIMLLRKYCEGGVLETIQQSPLERVVTISCWRSDARIHIATEMMGKHSNVVAIDDHGTILGALKTVPRRLSRVRPVLPGQPYLSPPAQSRDPALFESGLRLDPRVDQDLCARLLSALPPSTRAARALVGLLAGCSPFMSEQILRDAGYKAEAVAGSVEIPAVLASAQSLYGLFDSRAWSPCTFQTNRSRCDFAPYHPAGVRELQPVCSTSAAVEHCLGALESRDSLASARERVQAIVDRQRGAAQRKLAALNKGLVSASAAPHLMEQGRVILAYQHDIAPKSTELVVPDLQMVIPLDESLSPVENAERLFRRYRKLQEAERRLPAMIAETSTEMSRLDDISAFVQLARTEADLTELSKQVEVERPSKSPVKGKPKQPRQGARFRYGEFTAVVGRNARENDIVTFRVAHREDWWLHARERTGAHVILPAHAPPEIVERAASLAAYFSEARSDSRVDVNVLRVRNVRKVRGGPDGRVTHSGERTVRVQPTLEGWQPIG